jgi:hypothetical protein
MDWNDTPEQASFRSEVKSLIDDRLPDAYQGGKGEWVQDRKSENATKRNAAQAWQDALSNKGWIAPHCWRPGRQPARADDHRPRH